MKLIKLLASDANALVWNGAKPGSTAYYKHYVRNVIFHRAYSALIFYRYGHWAFQCKIPVWSHLHRLIYLLLVQRNMAWTGTEISYKAEIGPRCLLHHTGHVIGYATIGSNFVGQSGILIGQKNSVCPTIGDNVMMGARSVIVGNISIGDGAQIGAGTTIVKTVLPGQTVVSAPNRIID